LQNTVRLIVRLARFRQNILRVQPDVPLHTVFNLICEKLKFNDNAKRHHELRHPTQQDVILDMDQSLNHYSLREVYLAEKPGIICHKTFVVFSAEPNLEADVT